MANSFIDYECDGDVAKIVLSRESKCHALNEALLNELEHYLRETANNKEIRMVVLTATGERFFSAGGDIEAWSVYSSLDIGREWIIRGNDVFGLLRELPQLTVAVLNGHAFGGGLELAMACDLRVAMPKARLACLEVTLGMIPGWMGIERLSELLGPTRSREMLLLGKQVCAEQAKEWGLINEVVSSEEISEYIENLHNQVQAAGPVALAHIKQLLNKLESRNSGLEHQLMSALITRTEDCRSAVEAFKEKKKPEFKNQ